MQRMSDHCVACSVSIRAETDWDGKESGVGAMAVVEEGVVAHSLEVVVIVGVVLCLMGA